jgi:hypothetical protein
MFAHVSVTVLQAIGQAKMADENAIAKMLEVFQPGQV